MRNIADVLTPEGILFGGTVLGLQGNHTRSARAFLRAANKQGGFDNLDDTVEGLGRILEMSFSAVDVDSSVLRPSLPRPGHGPLLDAVRSDGRDQTEKRARERDQAQSVTVCVDKLHKVVNQHVSLVDHREGNRRAAGLERHSEIVVLDERRLNRLVEWMEGKRPYR